MLLRRLGSTVFWLFLLFSSIALFPFAVLIWAATVLFDKRLVTLHQFTCFWASLYTWLNPVWRVQIQGREKIAAGTAYVMVANHQSLLDILVLFRLFVHFKWVAKAELFRIACVGWNMSLNRYIRLRRGDPASIKRMMDDAERTLAEGSSLMIFPEGTRSPDGHLKAFKHGAFTLAQRAGMPILPIVVEGTANALPKHGFVLRGRHAIRVRVLDPVPAAAIADRPVDSVVAEFETLYARVLGEEPPRSRLSVAAAGSESAGTAAGTPLARPAG